MERRDQPDQHRYTKKVPEADGGRAPRVGAGDVAGTPPDEGTREGSESGNDPTRHPTADDIEDAGPTS